MEVLLTTLLLAMVVGALLPLLTSGQQGYDYGRRRQAMIQNGRVALDMLIREMRAAESFRTLTSGSAGQITFTLDWGDGTGAAPTVQYSLNSATHNLEYRWSADYDYREPITIVAVNAVASGYAVALTFNHAALVTLLKSLPSGDDVRVRYWNGTSMTELDRVVDPTSAWNNPITNTKIWFRLQAPIAAAGTDSTHYFLYYGNLSASNPPAYGPNVFLDYQDGTALDGWTRRDAYTGLNQGTYSPSATDGFVFNQASLTTGYRELSKNVPNYNDVEIFWGFWNCGGPPSCAPADNANGNQAGVGARLNDAGLGYRLIPGCASNAAFCIYYATTWAWPGGGTALAGVLGGVTTNASYYGRFYLVGSSLQGKVWQATAPEPVAWGVTVVNGNAPSGSHYSLVDSRAPSMDHRHRTLIIRPRVAVEPTLTPGLEASGARSDALAPLAGPFRSLTVACFDATNASIACAPATPVRAVRVTLVVMDPTGTVSDITLTDEAFRQTCPSATPPICR